MISFTFVENNKSYLFITQAEEILQISRVSFTLPYVIYRMTTVTNVMKCKIQFAHYSLEPQYNTFTVTEGTRSVPISASAACCKHTEEKEGKVGFNITHQRGKTMGTMYTAHHHSRD